MIIEKTFIEQNNDNNNNKMKHKINILHLHISFLIHSFPILAIRQRHYKTKRKEIKITEKENKKAINISINNGY